MKQLDLLKKLKLITVLSSVGLGVLSYKNDVLAEEQTSIVEEETTKNDNAYPTSSTDLITYYSNVFGIKEECIYDTLDYLVNENEEDYSDLSREQLILTATRKVYYDPKYADEIKRTNKEYEVTLTPEEMVEKYSEIYGINKEVALSIVYCECGDDVDSYNYRVNNNPAGLGPNMYFENKEIGIIYFINLLKESYGCKKDSGTDFLYSIAGTYCEIPDHWLSLTLPFYNNICEDYYYKRPELKKNNKVLSLNNNNKKDQD